MLYMYIVENTTLQVESDICVDYGIRYLQVSMLELFM